MKEKVKNPMDRQYIQGKDKAFKGVERSVRKVAEDTNATRRKQTLRPLKNKIKPTSFKRKASNEPKNIK
jgi:hypothetical protein